MPPLRITIVGAGVIGISSAYVISNEIQECKIKVVAEKFIPNNTGEVAAGLWGPYGIGDTPQSSIDKWSEETWNCMLDLSKKIDAKDWGVTLTSGAFVGKEPVTQPSWSHIAIDFKSLTPKECKEYGPHFETGIAFSSFAAEPAKILPKLTSTLESEGVEFVQKRLNSFEEVFADSDVIINCSGIGARFLVPDESVVPEKGQLVLVEAPWIKTFLCDENPETLAYILPTTDYVALGGSFDVGNWDREEDQEVTKTILARCRKLVPSLEKAKVLGAVVGLRPSRKGGVRLERETVATGGRSIEIIHNYGHGGAGITLMFGCAKEVASIVQGIIQERK